MMNESFEGDGSRRPLRPGEVANVDQMTAEFEELTVNLLRVHARAKVLVAFDESPEIAEQIAALQHDLFEVVAVPFLVDGEADLQKACSYMMYLIDVISTCHRREAGVTDKAARAAELLEQIRMDLGTVQAPKDVYVTGTGQTLSNIHRLDECDGTWCVIHFPLPGPWADWPTHWAAVEDTDMLRGFQRQCPCGVFHTAMEEVLRYFDEGEHVCCGLCPCGPPMAQPIYEGSTGALEGYR